MNYLQLAQRLHAESLRSTAAPTTVTGATDRNLRLFTLIADKWRNLQTERDWRWMRAQLNSPVTIGLQTYTGAGLGAARFGRWREEDMQYEPVIYRTASPSGYWALGYWDVVSFRREYIYRSLGNTTPIAWSYDENDQLLLGPAPAEAYNLRIDYWKSPSELAADADTPDMPDRFHMVLVWEALMDIATSDAAPEILANAQRNLSMLRQALIFDQARLPFVT